ncbi:MAG: DUF5668 domain-containing protein [Patescibacteria group bacterium]
MIFGVVLVLTGVVWFLQSIGLVDSTIWNLYFPMVLVFFGLSILFASEEHACLMCKVIQKTEAKPIPKMEPKIVAKAVVTKPVAKKKVTSAKKK